MKPTLCLDFDGVIHGYASRWKGADVIPDPPVPGAAAFLEAATEHFTVAVFSSRTNLPGGLSAMQAYVHLLLTEGLENGAAERVFAELQWPVDKPPAFLTIDDRAITFTGVWPDPKQLLEFRPWNKQ